MKFSHYLIFIFIFSIQNSFSQDINWKESKDWKLYDIHNMNAFSYSIDTLKNFNSIDLNPDLIQKIVSHAIKWPKDKYTTWMGLYVATCRTEGDVLRKIMISTYGGFFYDQTTKTYFEVDPVFRDQWYDLLNLNGKKISINLPPVKN